MRGLTIVSCSRNARASFVGNGARSVALVSLLVLVVPFGVRAGDDAPVPPMGLPATGGHSRNEAIPLEGVLRSDGTLDLRGGVRGSVSTAGWRMVTDADVAPRFVREAGGADGLGEAVASPPGLVSVPEDSLWDGRFYPQGTNGAVFALAMDGSGSLYAGGDFTTAGGGSAYHIAKWDGSAWSSLGSGAEDVAALVVDDSGILYAGGWFTTAGGVSASRIAKWDGSVCTAQMDALCERWWMVLTKPARTR